MKDDAGKRNYAYAQDDDGRSKMLSVRCVHRAPSTERNQKKFVENKEYIYLYGNFRSMVSRINHLMVYLVQSNVCTQATYNNLKVYAAQMTLMRVRGHTIT